MCQSGKSLMKYNKLDHLNGIMSQKSSKNTVHFLEAMLECAYHLDISVISLTPWGKTHNFDLWSLKPFSQSYIELNHRTQLTKTHCDNVVNPVSNLKPNTMCSYIASERELQLNLFEDFWHWFDRNIENQNKFWRRSRDKETNYLKLKRKLRCIKLIYKTVVL